MFAVGDTYVSDYVDYVVGQSLDDKVAEVEQVKEMSLIHIWMVGTKRS